MKSAVLIVFGTVLAILTYCAATFWGYRLFGVWFSSASAVALGIFAREYKTMLKEIATIFAGFAISPLLAYLILSIFNHKFMDPDFYGESIRLGGFLGLIVLLPMITFASVVFFLKKAIRPTRQ